MADAWLLLGVFVAGLALGFAAGRAGGHWRGVLRHASAGGVTPPPMPEISAGDAATAPPSPSPAASALNLTDVQVADIMIHRTEMDTLSADDPAQRIIEAVLKSRYSRLPLWRGSPENIVGLLQAKSLLKALSNRGGETDGLDIMAFAEPAWFVPDTTTLRAQLDQFLKRRAEMALVIDEYGEVQGLVTLEDIIEEIAGLIAVGTDADPAHIRVQTDGTVNVDGTVAVRDINRRMGWTLPEDDATTIAGLVIHEVQSIPDPGQVFTFYGYRFEVLRKSRNRIAAVRIKRLGGR
jgi:Mg2+/Co2+ transporter CorB